MSRRPKRCARFILSAICTLAAGSSARAADMFWNTGSGSFHTAANWTGGIPIFNPPPPNNNDIARFGRSSNPPFQFLYTVSFSTDVTNQAFRVEDDSVTFDLNGKVYITTSASPITIGTSSALSGSLVIIDGNVAVTSNSTLSLGAGGAGFLSVGAGGLLAGSAMDISIGGAGGGTLLVNGGGDVVAESLIIGNQVSPSPLSQATISGAGSALAGADVTVGRNGGGSLRISAGGAIESTSGVIGDFAGSGGLVIVENASSRWLNSGSLVVGDAGNGGLIVIGGGRVTSESGVIGRVAGSNSGATITGANSQWSLDLGLDVGIQGTGSLTVDDGGAVTAPGGLSVGAFGTLRGDGQINGNVGNAGVVAPGTSPGTLHINGHYTQQAGGKTQIEIGGPTPGSQFDMLDITGRATLQGTLQVSLIDGFSPTGFTVFEVVHADGGVIGSFDTLLLPMLPNGMAWSFAETSVSFFLIAQSATLQGDFNDDGHVDAADYVVWRKTDGMPMGYNIWRSHFGQTAGNGSASSAKSAVPEPSSSLLLVLAAASWSLRKSALRREIQQLINV